MKPILSVIYVYFNTPDELARSIKSLKQACSKLSYEVIVVDNASSLPIPKNVVTSRNVSIVTQTHNMGYGAGLNRGIAHAKADIVVLLNPDTLIEKNAFFLMYEALKKDKTIGLIGPQLRNLKHEVLPNINGELNPLTAIFAFSFLNTLFPKNTFSKRYWMRDMNKENMQQVATIGGACFMARKAVLEKIKGFDEAMFLYFEEADIAKRVRKARYRIVYFPKAKVVHLVGRSMHDKEQIEKHFEKSRFYYLRKYYGFIKAMMTEIFLRLTKTQNILLFSILLFSASLNLYNLDMYMMYIGDFGRDYLAARDMLLTGTIPLVGIPSSVVWLHQGPLSIYLIGLAFLLSDFHPIAPAVLYGVLGIVATYVVYLLGKTYFNKTIGLLAGAFYASAPLAVVNVRMPYHTSSMPLLAGATFFFLYKVLQGKRRYLFLLFFFSGLLLQVELSNAVIFFIFFLFYCLYRPRITRKNIIHGFLGISFGMVPFILYDITHKFVQTIGFPLWIINRIRLFFGLTVLGHATSASLPKGLQTMWDQIIGMLLPASEMLSILLLLILCIFLFRNKHYIFSKTNPSLLLTLVWIIIPLLGFAIHAAPGTAYFPLIYPAIALLIGFLFYNLTSFSRFFLILFLGVVLFNAYFIIKHEYFLITNSAFNTIPPSNYSFGFTIPLTDEVARFIVNDAKGKAFQVKSGGYVAQFATGVDNYKYLIWYYGGNISAASPTIYTIYQEKREVPKEEHVVFQSKYFAVTKNEK